jgi:hypothetical protein
MKSDKGYDIILNEPYRKRLERAIRIANWKVLKERLQNYNLEPEKKYKREFLQISWVALRRELRKHILG